MIEIQNLTVMFDDVVPLKDFSCRIVSKGVVAVLGASGSGKTTLLRVLAGLIKPTIGALHGLNDHRIAYVFQEDRLIKHISVQENVRIVNSAKDPLGVLKLVGLENTLNKLPAELSGGMQRRVAIARALHFGGDILLLDEPFKGLDDELKGRVADAISGMYPLIIIATHSLSEARLIGEVTQTIKIGVAE